MFSSEIREAVWLHWNLETNSLKAFAGIWVIGKER